MAIIAFTTHTTLGNALAMNVTTSNVPTIQSSVKQGTDAFAYRLNPIAGSDTSYLRLTSRSATTGITAMFTQSEVFVQMWVRWATFPAHEEFALMTDTVDSVPSAALRIKSTGIVQLQDLDDIASATNTASADNALATGTWYRIRWRLNYTSGTSDVLIYNEAGTLVSSIAATSLNFGLNQAGRLYLSWGQSLATAGITGNFVGNASESFDMFYGNAFVATTSYPDANQRVGVLRPLADGNASGFTASTGTRVACVQQDDGNTSYIVSTASAEAASFTVQTFAAAGITTASIEAFSPYGVYWDAGAAPTIATRFRWNGSNNDLTGADPGPDADFHLRGRIYTAMPDASAITQAKIEASEVGCVRNAATTEVRCGSLGIHVVYVPGQIDLQRLSYSRLSLDRLSTSRL